MHNAAGVSEHNLLPRFWSDKERLAQERAKIAEGLSGKAKWELYHKKLPLLHIPIA